ncbi:hypothetical protein MC7420_6579 [Coleofasciculus chthonoplastes PCC 7420]|uniref:Uncharacterized protein n=1 Tax=Coleofasciculus chthonoplastes PCC 7420 TaxID=118168 RepID=B4W5A3_9CYAN|nr:hypothetical protein [Coleofasciculus chthonoplastes]EDX70654.1 hypothetical protein MC7420_6579 [Coleofasciculus chthonoplastes PCC 7420]
MSPITEQQNPPFLTDSVSTEPRVGTGLATITIVGAGLGTQLTCHR